MLVRKLLFLALAVGIGWVIQRLVNAASRRTTRPSAPHAGGSVRSAPPMVRDRVCNTFLPEASALVTVVDGDRHYFCSERCRRQFLEGAGTTASTVS